MVLLCGALRFCLLGVVMVGDRAACCGAGEGVATADIMAGDTASYCASDAALGQQGGRADGAGKSGRCE